MGNEEVIKSVTIRCDLPFSVACQIIFHIVPLPGCRVPFLLLFYASFRLDFRSADDDPSLASSFEHIQKHHTETPQLTPTPTLCYRQTHSQNSERERNGQIDMKKREIKNQKSKESRHSPPVHKPFSHQLQVLQTPRPRPSSRRYRTLSERQKYVDLLGCRS